MNLVKATLNSHTLKRQEIARRIEKLLPSSLASEVAITGSTSRNSAEAESDLELNIWASDFPASICDKLHWMKSRLSFLSRLGAEQIVFDQTPIVDDSMWATFLLDGIWVELSCQSIARQENWIEQLTTVGSTDHRLLVMADAILHALPLRTSGIVSRWQQRLARYPAGLQELLILEAADMWTFPLHVESCWVLNPDDPLLFLDRLLTDAHAILRIIFAINHQWEPDWKRLSNRIRSLLVAPENSGYRINQIFQNPMCITSRKSLYTIALEALALTPDGIDVSTSMQVIRDSILQHELGDEGEN